MSLDVNHLPPISEISTFFRQGHGTSRGAPRAPAPSARSHVPARLERPPRARDASQTAAPGPGGGIPSQRLGRCGVSASKLEDEIYEMQISREIFLEDEKYIY